jgi:CBS domain-containing membrane protein
MMHLFQPILAGGTFSDRVIACLGALVCLSLTAALCVYAPHAPGLPSIVAPLGASAVLVFAVPSSPLAQPWSVIGGNAISAAVGVATYHIIPEVPLASGVAVAAAMMIMSLARCLHPPGGAAALTAVIGAPSVHAMGFWFALSPVALNSALLVAFGIAFHRLSGHAYPHRVASPAQSQREQYAGSFAPEDIDAALADMHETFDIARQDIDQLLAQVQTHARQRIAEAAIGTEQPPSNAFR